MNKQEMLQQMELDIELQGFAIVNVDGKAYLHIRMSNILGDKMAELIEQNNIYKIIFH